MTRDAMLDRVRRALGRRSGQPLPAPPPPLLRPRQLSASEKVEQFSTALRKLSGEVYVASDFHHARGIAESILQGRSAIASRAPILRDAAIVTLPNVTLSPDDFSSYRNVCSQVDVGISSAYCLLAETGTLVMRADFEEPRMISLLPPAHIAVVQKSKLLANLDEYLTMKPMPVEDTSSTVFITGPSRTGDIEQILVRGVHGPGSVHVILI